MYRMILACLSLLLLSTTAGCGRFIARRIAQAPNAYPTWFAPAAPVELEFDSRLLTNFPARWVKAGPPDARLLYRIVPPQDFHLKTSTTNWVERQRPRVRFSFHASFPGEANSWTRSPKGTVILLHGYGLAQFSMLPWALYLAEQGWGCVLVDLRGHGKSTGRRIFFGTRETRDLSQLVDALMREGQLHPPLSAIGDSYGAALALRWKAREPRLDKVVAIAPYASLSNATLNLAREYAGWFPQSLLRAGLGKLPGLLRVAPIDLDTTTVLSTSSVSALIVAGTEDKIMPLADVRELFRLAAPGSELLEVPGATHETVPYYFDAIGPVLVGWLELQAASPDAPDD